MARSPYSVDQTFLDRKAEEEAQDAIRSNDDYAARYLQEKPGRDAAVAKQRATDDSMIQNPIGRVATGAMADLYGGTSQLFGKLSSIATMLEQETGWKSGGLFKDLKNSYLHNAVYYDRMIGKRGVTEDTLMSIIGGAAPGILNYMPGPAGIPFHAAAGFSEAREQGKGYGDSFGDALVSAAKRFILGKTFDVIGGKGMGLKGEAPVKGFFESGVPGKELSTYAKNVAAMGGIGAADTMISSGLKAGPADVAQGAVSMGVLGAMGGPKMPRTLSEKETSGIRQESAASDVAARYYGSNLEKFDLRNREENKQYWQEMYAADPQTWGPKTPYDTPEIIIARNVNKDLPQTLDIQTGERAQWRENMVNYVYGDGAQAKEKQVYLVIGPPGAGKSTQIVDKIASGSGAKVFDSDNIKQDIPEFRDGLGAGLVHTESDWINSRAYERGMLNGDSMILPLVGKNVNTIRSIRDKFLNLGYNVHLTYVDLPESKAAGRVAERYYQTGRFVDPLYVINGVDANPRRTFETLINEGGLSSHAAYDADVPRGTDFRSIPEWTSRAYAGGRIPGAATHLYTGPGVSAAEGAEAVGGTSRNVPQPANPVTAGKPTSILHAEGEDAARYVLADAGDIQASHDPMRSFALNPAYPGNEVDVEGRAKMLAQERPYHLDKDLQGKVAAVAGGIRPEFLVTDNPDPVNGPPIITPDMMVPGGNRRAMALRLMYEQNPDQAAVYKQYLVANAERFGLNPQQVAGMQRPVLARMLLDRGPDSDVNNFARKVRLYNQSFTAGSPLNAEYVSKARMLSQDSLETLAAGLKDNMTLREYMSKSQSYDLFRSLMNDGVIEGSKVATYWNEKTGLLTNEGKSLVEGVLRGKIINDYDLLAVAPPMALQRIDRAIPSLAKVAGMTGGWDITPKLKTALEEYTKFRAGSFPNVSEYLRQDALFGERAEFLNDSQAVQLLKMLDGSTPTQFADRMAGYARSAEMAQKLKDQGSLGFFTPLEPADAFRKYVEGDQLIDGSAGPVEQYRIATELGDYASPKEILGDLADNIMHDLPIMASARTISVKDLPLFGGAKERMYRPYKSVGAEPGKRTLDQLDIFNERTREEVPAEEPEMTRTLGKKLDDALFQDGEINWAGVQVGNINDLGLAIQVYRDPRFETNRIFYAKQNEDGTYTILHHAGMTQRLPDRCVAVRVKSGSIGRQRMTDGINSLIDHADKYGATHIFTTHNHPQSFGSVEPSNADTVIAMTFAARLGPKYAGSIIIDGENFHTFTPRFDVKLTTEEMDNHPYAASLSANGAQTIVPVRSEWVKLPPGPDKFAGVAIPHEIIGKVIRTTSDIAACAKDIAENPDYGVLLIRGVDGDIRLLMEIHKDVLGDTEKVAPIIQDAATKNGGMPYVWLRDSKMLADHQVRGLLRNNLCENVFITEPGRGAVRGSRQILEADNMTLGKKSSEWPIYHVRAIKKEITDDLFPDISDPESPASKMINDSARQFIEMKSNDIDLNPDLDLNWKRIQTETDVADALKRTIQIFEKPELEAKGYESAAMTKQLATEIGMTPESLLQANGGQAFGSREIMAMRWVNLSSVKKLKELAKLAVKSTDEVDAFNFRKQLALCYGIQCQFYKYRAESGRALNAWKIVAKDSDAMMADISKAVMESGGSGTAREMAIKVLGMDRPEQIATFARQAHTATKMDMVLEAVINGWLSNPVSHAANITSNALSMVWQVPERWLASKISRVMDPQQEVYEGEATQMLYGMVQGFKDSLMMSVRGKDAMRQAGSELSHLDLVNAKETMSKALEESSLAETPLFGQGEGPGGDFGPAWKALISGDTSGQLGKLEVSRRAITAENMKANFPRVSEVLQRNGFDLGLAMDLLGEGIRGPGRLLMTEDEVFKGGGYRMQLHSLAFRQASKEGLTGDAAATRMQEIISNPPKDLKADAIDYANYLTFTNSLSESENMLAQASAKVSEATIKAPPLRFILPFIRTPINILLFTAERTPLGLFMKSVRNDIFSGTGPERSLAIARLSLGSMVMALTYEMTASGLITGGGPSDPELRQAYLRSGWQPYSLRIGKDYVSFNRLEPLGSVVGMAADLSEIWTHLHEEGRESERDSIASMVVATLAKNLVSKTYMEGFSRFVDAIHDPDRYGESYVNRFFSSMVPSGVAQVERMIDPTVRETQGLLDGIRARIPGFSADLPPKRNLWGEPIRFEGALGPDIVSPFYSSRDKDSAIDNEIVANRIDNIQTPTARQVYAGVELTPEQHSRYLEIMGQEIKPTGKNLKEHLGDMVQTPEYQGLTDGPMGGKAFQISRIVHQYREQAKQYLIAENPEVRDKILGIKTRKVTARTGAMPTFQ